MNTLIGIFHHRSDADAAVDDLKNMGISSRDISILMKKDEDAQAAEDGAATGATTGGIIGGIAGLLVGLGAIALPGIGAVLVGGPLITALGLTGAAATAASTIAGGITGAVAGGLVGGLIGLGFSEDDARLYESKIKEGGILLALDLHDENERGIREIFANHHATDIKTLTTEKSAASLTA